jgi:hypothetical protein
LISEKNEILLFSAKALDELYVPHLIDELGKQMRAEKASFAACEVLH